jgi:hypothetical protein
MKDRQKLLTDEQWELVEALLPPPRQRCGMLFGTRELRCETRVALKGMEVGRFFNATCNSRRQTVIDGLPQERKRLFALPTSCQNASQVMSGHGSLRLLRSRTRPSISSTRRHNFFASSSRPKSRSKSAKLIIELIVPTWAS